MIKLSSIFFVFLVGAMIVATSSGAVAQSNLSGHETALQAQPLSLADSPAKGDVNLREADLLVDAADFKVVQIAADCLASDVERVTGKKPHVQTEARGLSRQAVIIGTIGKSGVLDGLIRSGKLDVKSIEGKWESFLVTTVENPLPGVETALVIAGSDRRGAAYGVFTMSETIGVSPWYWWADVPTVHRDTLALKAGTYVGGPPSVKYRGIFINDEDWGIRPWASTTFDSDTKNIGPKTYAKVCELLLRLKANYLWPAMHPGTKAFNFYPGDKEVADDYAIVMGSSHAEPMLRNNVSEWDKTARGEWDYTKNREQVLKYWDERVVENSKYENVYTLGMRGIHDGAMPGPKSIPERVGMMEDIFQQQRAMLAKYVNAHPELVPQVFVPYKEVLELYRNGLKVPDDITLMWVDDNHGYVRQLSNPEERKRSGGSGVYYHISYWGKPEDYLWLDSVPPALIWEEMHKSYENGADRIWVLNVGDIKPMEIGMEFFLRMAWDMTPWKEDSQPRFLADWAARTFGADHAKDIAAIMDEYYRLNFPSKPEHLHLSTFTNNYGEIDQRLQRFASLVEKANTIWAEMPADRKDSFFEMVLYPVRGAALANQTNLGASLDDKLKAYDQLQVETAYFNETVAGGKWKNIISSNPRKRPALTRPDASKPPVVDAPATAPSGGYLSFEAEKPTHSSAAPGTDWKVISGLGRSGDSIALLPTTVGALSGAELDYDFNLAEAADVKAMIYSLPTLPLNSDLHARYSVSIDGGEPQTFDIATAEFSKEWSANVLRGAAIFVTSPIKLMPGRHTLKLSPLDPGLVFDKVVLDLGGLLPTHLGPPATTAAQ